MHKVVFSTANDKKVMFKKDNNTLTYVKHVNLKAGEEGGVLTITTE